jgi:hypothetical protein
MLQGTVSTIAGLAVWYAIKFAFVHHARPAARHKKLLLPVLATLVLALVAWESDSCDAATRDNASVLVIISACAALADVVLEYQPNPALISAPNASVGAGLAYVYIAAVLANPGTHCTVLASVLSSSCMCLLAVCHLLL